MSAEKKISPKARKKLALILDLKNQLNQWRSSSEDEILLLLKEFEKKPRDEVSFWYNEALSDDEFATTLLEIAGYYQHNSKVARDLVSTLGYMIQRYQLTPTNQIFQYFLANAAKKDVAFFVSLFLPHMPQFQTYDQNWQYLMSIKNIKPIKNGRESFRLLINKFWQELPLEYLSETIVFLEEAVSDVSSVHSKDSYQELIYKLKSRHI